MGSDVDEAHERRGHQDQACRLHVQEPQCIWLWACTEHSKGRWLCSYGPFSEQRDFGTRERKNCLRRRSRVSGRMLYLRMQNLLCNITSVLSRVSFSPANYPALGRRRCRLPGFPLDPDLLCALPCGPVEKGDSNQLGSLTGVSQILSGVNGCTWCSCKTGQGKGKMRRTMVPPTMKVPNPLSPPCASSGLPPGVPLSAPYPGP